LYNITNKKKLPMEADELLLLQSPNGGSDDYPLLISPSFMEKFKSLDLNPLNELVSPTLPSPPLTTSFLIATTQLGGNHLPLPKTPPILGGEIENQPPQHHYNDALRTPTFPELKSNHFLGLHPEKNNNLAKQLLKTKLSTTLNHNDFPQTPGKGFVYTFLPSDFIVFQQFFFFSKDPISTPEMPSPPKSTSFLRVRESRFKDTDSDSTSDGQSLESKILRTPDLPEPVTTPIFRLKKSNLSAAVDGSVGPNGSPVMSTPPLPSPPKSTHFLRNGGDRSVYFSISSSLTVVLYFVFPK